MSSWRVHFDPTHWYFITASAVQRAHLFQRDIMKQIILDSWAYTRNQGWIELYAFVVMPNHIHLIVQCSKHPVADMARDFKKYTAKRIIVQYEREGNERALAFLQQAVKRPSRQDHAVWEAEYQAKNVFSASFLRQKMEYVHNNPLQPHWQLAQDPSDFAWSSARFYLRGELALIPVDDASPWLV